MSNLRALLLTGVALTLPHPAWADDAGDDVHPDAGADIVVTAPYARARIDTLSAIGVLDAEALTRELRSSIGETLARQPGVSATSFGPNASRPVLRGFQGERIRVLTDGIGSFDVSNTSADHAVVINPLLAERVEIVRGAASLLYGSSAIGGVVNVVDRRIARQVPEGHLHADMIGTYGSASDDRSAGAAVDVPVSAMLVLHVDASYAKSGDLRIGGNVLSAPLAEQARAAGLPALANARDVLANTAARTWDVAGGLSWIGEAGNFGFSVARHDSLYGVPIRPSLDPAVEAEEVRLDIHQTRADARAEVDLDGVFETLRARFGYADYGHVELTEDGPGTQFLNKGFEGRIELAQARRGMWRGATGVQLLTRKFDAVGEEAFVPPNDTVQAGWFALQEVDLGGAKLEASARLESTNVESRQASFNRSFTTLSGAVGGNVSLADNWRLGLNLSRTARAPSAEELLANGPHAGTQSYEIGDPAFGIERSWGVEGTLKGKGDGFAFEAAVFWNRFGNYIYEQQTGAALDDLPVFAFRQADATYLGFEVNGSAAVAETGAWTFVADALADHVRATVKGVGPAPRIPSFRVLGGLEAQSESATVRIELERVSGQARVAAFETSTPGYTQVNASAEWKPFGSARDVSLLLAGNNLFDVDSRRHASFLKDFAPLAGRDVRITLRSSF